VGTVVTAARNGGRVEEAVLGAIGFLIGVIAFVFPAGYLNRAASAMGRVKRIHRMVDVEDALEAQRMFWKFCGTVGIVVCLLFGWVGIMGVMFGR